MSAQPPLPQLGALDELLRALLNKRSLDHLPDAFMLRYEERDSGLSVSINSTAQECRVLFRTTYGVLLLTVAQVRELDLAVVPDAPKHANITGIPHKEDDPDRAEWLANRLAERAIIVEQGKVVQEQ